MLGASFAPIPPPHLDLRSRFLLVQPADFRAARELSWPPLLRRAEDGEHHRTQLVVTRLNVPWLIAELFTVNYDLASVRHAGPIARQEPLANIRRQAGRSQHVEVQDRLARYLVHILSAGTAAAGKRQPQLGVRDFQGCCDFEVHGNSPQSTRRIAERSRSRDGLFCSRYRVLSSEYEVW